MRPGWLDTGLTSSYLANLSLKFLLKDKLKQVTGQLLYISIINYIHEAQYHERINSIKAKSYILKRLIGGKNTTIKI